MKIGKTLIVLFSILLITASETLAVDMFEDMYSHMRYLSERDKILSENIANGDTPGFKSKDLQKRKFIEPKANLHITNPDHINFDDNASNFNVFESEYDEVKPNGNNINLENELFKKNENSAMMKESINTYNKAKSMINSVISKK